MEDAGTSEEDDNINSQDSNTPIDHGYLAQNCSIKIKPGSVRLETMVLPLTAVVVDMYRMIW